MKNKIKKIGTCIGGLALLTGSFFAGRESIQIPETAVEIFRTNNQAFLIRIYNKKERWDNSIEITDGSEAIDYSTIGKKEYRKKMDFQKRNPHVEIYVKDMDK